MPRCHFGAAAELELLEEEDEDTTRYSTRAPSRKRGGGGGGGEACLCLCNACEDEDEEEEDEDEDGADAVVRKAGGQSSSSLASEGDVDEHRSMATRDGETRPPIPPPPLPVTAENVVAAVANLDAGSCGVGGALLLAEAAGLALAAVGDDAGTRVKKSVTARCVVGDCAAMPQLAARALDGRFRKREASVARAS